MASSAFTNMKMAFRTLLKLYEESALSDMGILSLDYLSAINVKLALESVSINT